MNHFYKTIINEYEEPIRLDRYIRRIFPKTSQGVIEKALRARKITINGERAKSGRRIINGDKINYDVRLFVANERAEESFSSSAKILAKKILSEYLIFSCDEFIAINKPYGLAVQGGSKINLSIDEALKFLNYEHKEEYKLVHRLDKETSGILLIARGYTNANRLCEAFKQHLIQKIYVAILAGKPKQSSGRLIHDIAKDRSGVFETVKETEENGKKAETEYKILSLSINSSSEQKTLIEFKPKTGRMHQLRFHAKMLGCPIIGDDKYGGPRYKRMLLHARQVIIDSSVFGREIEIKSDAEFSSLELC